MIRSRSDIENYVSIGAGNGMKMCIKRCESNKKMSLPSFRIPVIITH